MRAQNEDALYDSRPNDDGYAVWLYFVQSEHFPRAAVQCYITFTTENDRKWRQPFAPPQPLTSAAKPNVLADSKVRVMKSPPICSVCNSRKS